MTKKKREKKCTNFSGKILKKVVEKFFWEMCSDEFFLKHALRDSVFWNRKKLRDADHEGASSIYINELLTKQTANLFKRVRQMTKNGTFYRCWTTDGLIKVLLSDDQGAKPIKIYNESDLKNLMPS